MHPQSHPGREIHQRPAVRIRRPVRGLRRSEAGSGGVQVPQSGGRAGHRDAVPGVDGHPAAGGVRERQRPHLAKYGNADAGTSDHREPDPESVDVSVVVRCPEALSVELGERLDVRWSLLRAPAAHCQRWQRTPSHATERPPYVAFRRRIGCTVRDRHERNRRRAR